jgi:histidine triad (HIT) family protein
VCYADRAVFRHAPPDYVCPFCLIIAGGDNRAPYSVQSDVVFRGLHATAFINARWWPNNPGHVLVIPNAHVENMYELVPELSAHVHEAARQVALAFKAVYLCDGVSTRQHNEPGGDQEVWHYHLHVFPRYSGDRLYTLSDQHRFTSASERAPYAARLRAHFAALETSATGLPVSAEGR